MASQTARQCPIVPSPNGRGQRGRQLGTASLPEASGLEGLMAVVQGQQRALKRQQRQIEQLREQVNGG